MHLLLIVLLVVLLVLLILLRHGRRGFLLLLLLPAHAIIFISKQVAQRKEAVVVDSVLALASLESGATNASRLPHFMLTLIVLPRQARDKHSESTQKRDAGCEATRRLLLQLLPPVLCFSLRKIAAEVVSACVRVPAPANISVNTAETSAIRVS